MYTQIHFNLKSWCWQIMSMCQPLWHYMHLKYDVPLWSHAFILICASSSFHDNCNKFKLQSATDFMYKSLMLFELFAGCGRFCMQICFVSHVTELRSARMLSRLNVSDVVCAALKCISNFNVSINGSIGYRGSSCSGINGPVINHSVVTLTTCHTHQSHKPWLILVFNAWKKPRVLGALMWSH